MTEYSPAKTEEYFSDIRFSKLRVLRKVFENTIACISRKKYARIFVLNIIYGHAIPTISMVTLFQNTKYTDNVCLHERSVRQNIDQERTNQNALIYLKTTLTYNNMHYSQMNLELVLELETQSHLKRKIPSDNNASSWPLGG